MNQAKLTVLGLGPGHPDYILPVVKKRIQTASVLACGRRHLESVQPELAEADFDFIEVGGGHPLSESLEKIKAALQKDEDVCVLVSGDPGFYSMLNYLKKQLPNQKIDVIPGISSLQYLFSAVSLDWQEAILASLHGRNFDLDQALESGKTLGLLCDKTHNAGYVAKKLKEHQLNRMIVVGENLSYSEERISVLSADEALGFSHDPMSVILVCDPNRI